MKKVCIVSKNKEKIEAVKSAFQKMLKEDQNKFIYLDLMASSNVKEQPLSDKETKQGATNRINNAKEIFQDYDYYITIEVGIEPDFGSIYNCFHWVCLFDGTNYYYSRSVSFALPKTLTKYLADGIELSQAEDLVFLNNNSEKTGALSVLSKNELNRKDWYEQTVKAALLPLINPDVY